MKDLTLENIKNIKNNFYLVEFEKEKEKESEMNYYICLESEEKEIYKKLYDLTEDYKEVYCRILKVEKEKLLKDFEEDDEILYYDTVEQYNVIDSLNFIEEFKQYNKIEKFLIYDNIDDIENVYDLDFDTYQYEDEEKLKEFKNILKETEYNVKKWSDEFQEKNELLETIEKYKRLINEF